MKIIEQIIKKIERKKFKKLNEKIDFYNKDISVSDKFEFQKVKFNKSWKFAYENYSFYKKWKNVHNLPNEIDNINQLKNFPVIKKNDIRSNFESIYSEAQKFKNIFLVSTGGSTGEPTQFPCTLEEKKKRYSNVYLGRSWWNIHPFDKTVLIWGHRHLFGSGINGKIKNLKRIILDKLINTKRLNAYKMSEKSILDYIKIINKKKPSVLIGYSSAISKIAQLSKISNISMSDNKLKGIILTAESVSENQIKLIKNVFNTSIILEYGMAELGVVAYSKDDTQNYNVFWDSFVCNYSQNGLIVSTIDDGIFPMIRYQTNDLIEPNFNKKNSIITFSGIKGREQEKLSLLTLSKEFILCSGLLISHILWSYPGIMSFYFKQIEKGKILIYYETFGIIDEKKIFNHIIKELNKVFSDIEPKSINLRNEKNLKLTISGKSILVKH